MPQPVLIDTGPLVALLDRRESHPQWASGIASRLHGTFLTCGAVLSEATFVLSLHPPAMARLRKLVDDGIVCAVEENTKLWIRALVLMERYANVPMSFADACLIAMTEVTPGARVFTLDRDFLIYRQDGEKPIALLAPFAQEV